MYLETQSADGANVLLVADNMTSVQRKTGSESGKQAIIVQFIGGPPFTIELEEDQADTLWTSIKQKLGEAR